MYCLSFYQSPDLDVVGVDTTGLHFIKSCPRSLKADYPDAQILGHCDQLRVRKACPCFSARNVLT